MKQSSENESATIEQQSEMLLIESQEMNEDLTEDNEQPSADQIENNQLNEQAKKNNEQDPQKVDQPVIEKQSIAAKEKLYFNKASESETADNLVIFTLFKKFLLFKKYILFKLNFSENYKRRRAYCTLSKLGDNCRKF